MTPPEAPLPQTDGPPAVSLRLEVLKTRPEFLAAARGMRSATPGFVLQAHRPEKPREGIRVGFTCSKKVGNAVARNRAKRRLREVARLVLPDHGRVGWDYVLIGRQQTTADLPLTSLCHDLERALTRIHGA